MQFGFAWRRMAQRVVLLGQKREDAKLMTRLREQVRTLGTDRVACSTT